MDSGKDILGKDKYNAVGVVFIRLFCYLYDVGNDKLILEFLRNVAVICLR